MEPIAVSVADACQALGIGRTKIYELIGEGRLAAFKIGRRTLIRAASLHAFAASCEEVST